MFLWSLRWNFIKRTDKHYWSGATPSCCCCLVTQLCSALCDPMDCSSPGSSVRGILQARILEWVAISSSRESSRPRDWTWVSPGKNTGVGCHLFLQGIFLTQGLNPGLLHCRQTLYPCATREAPLVILSSYFKIRANSMAKCVAQKLCYKACKEAVWLKPSLPPPPPQGNKWFRVLTVF